MARIRHQLRVRQTRVLIVRVLLNLSGCHFGSKAHLRETKVLVCAQQRGDCIAAGCVSRRQTRLAVAAARRGIGPRPPPSVVGREVEVDAEADAAAIPGERVAGGGPRGAAHRDGSQQQHRQRDQPSMPA